MPCSRRSAGGGDSTAPTLTFSDGSAGCVTFVLRMSISHLWYSATAPSSGSVRTSSIVSPNRFRFPVLKQRA